MPGLREGQPAKEPQLRDLALAGIKGSNAQDAIEIDQIDVWWLAGGLVEGKHRHRPDRNILRARPDQIRRIARR
jgi:hypothetical protein